MRITRQTLLKTAEEFAAQRARTDRKVICIYLIGSLLEEHPLLGGTTDIDLVIVHAGDPTRPHEIVRLSPDVTLDIAHHSQAMYNQPRNLRLDPWLGPAVYYNPILLFDTHHWFDFAQSSVGAGFTQPDNVLARARHLADAARRLWLDLQAGEITPESALSHYLEALEAAANAVASLTGPPLTERRLLLRFPERAQALQRPGLSAGLMGLLGANEVDEATLHGWLPDWEAAFQAAGTAHHHPTRLNPARLPYYRRALEAMLEAERPLAALWPLLSTWTLAVGCLVPEAPERAAWQAARHALRLDAASFDERLTGLDAYLDGIEETLEDWGQEYGA